MFFHWKLIMFNQWHFQTVQSHYWCSQIPHIVLYEHSCITKNVDIAVLNEYWTFSNYDKILLYLLPRWETFSRFEGLGDIKFTQNKTHSNRTYCRMPHSPHAQTLSGYEFIRQESQHTKRLILHAEWDRICFNNHHH